MLAEQPASAQTFPSKALRLIVPFAAGGNTDIIARFYAPKMSELLGQQIIIDNRGGAGGTIGSEMVAKAAPDGYTLLMVSEGHTINPAMIRKIPYDSIKSFAPVSLLVAVPNALLVHPSLPVKDVKQLVALARTHPDSINYSTAGRGTVGHLSAELFSSIAKLKLVHVPYKGANDRADGRAALGVRAERANDGRRGLSRLRGYRQLRHVGTGEYTARHNRPPTISGRESAK